MSVHKTRGFLYWLARLLGDYSAVSSGSPKKMVKRAGRRITGRAAGKAMRKLFKWEQLYLTEKSRNFFNNVELFNNFIEDFRHTELSSSIYPTPLERKA